MSLLSRCGALYAFLILILVQPSFVLGQTCGGQCELSCYQLCIDYEEWEIPVCDLARCECRAKTPIIINLVGNSLELTDFLGGVHFDLDADGVPEQTSWTGPNAQAAFLVLDRNGNGTVDDGTELFGNKTPVPSGVMHTGFSALAEFDKFENGGNRDSVIDHRDAVFGNLRLWIDHNHDGISQRNELFRLSELGVVAISLEYQTSNHQDQFGNLYRYRSDVTLYTHQRRFAFDVYLLDK